MFIAAMAVANVLFLVMLTAVGFYSASQHVADLAHISSGEAAQTLEQKMASTTKLLTALSLVPRVRNPDLPLRARAVMLAPFEKVYNFEYLTLIDAHGLSFDSVGAASGEPSFSLLNAPAFQTVSQTRAPFISNLLVRNFDQRFSLTLAMPVFADDSPNAALSGVLMATHALGDYSAALQENVSLADVVVFDRNGLPVALSSARFDGPAAQQALGSAFTAAMAEFTSPTVPLSTENMARVLWKSAELFFNSSAEIEEFRQHYGNLVRSASEQNTAPTRLVEKQSGRPLDSGLRYTFHSAQVNGTDFVVISRGDNFAVLQRVIWEHPVFFIVIFFLLCICMLSLVAFYNRLHVPYQELVQSVQALQQKAHPEQGDNDVVDFIKTALSSTQSMMNDTECFFSIETATNRVEMAFGEFQGLTGHELPHTFNEINSLLNSLLLEEDRPMFQKYQAARLTMEPHIPNMYTLNVHFMDQSRYLSIVETKVIADDGTHTNTMVRITDITTQTLRERQLEQQARRDSFTGLYNKAAFELSATQALRDPQCEGNIALVLLDIDFFKNANDTLGHQRGDEALLTLTAYLREKCRSSDVLGRFGGDEFAVLCVNISSAMPIINRFQCMTEELKSTVLKPWNLSISVGIAFQTCDEEDYRTLFQRADEALYDAKRTGRSRVCVNSV